MVDIVKRGIKKCFNAIGLEIRRKPKDGGRAITRLTNELEYFETVTGKYYLPKYTAGDGIAYAIKHDMIYDTNVYSIAAKYIKEGTIALDVGSNFGQMAVLFSKVCPNVEVYAFEASPVVYPIMEKNVRINTPPRMFR